MIYFNFIFLEVFDPFLKKYLFDNKFGTVVTSDFQSQFTKYCNDAGVGDKIKDVDWDTWYNKPGMPILENVYVFSLFSH